VKTLGNFTNLVKQKEKEFGKTGWEEKTNSHEGQKSVIRISIAGGGGQGLWKDQGGDTLATLQAAASWQPWHNPINRNL